MSNAGRRPAMASSSSSGVRSWRAAFQTLRDETLTPLPPPALADLLRGAVLSRSDSLVAVASQLPPHEVTADVMLLAELASAVSEFEDGFDACVHICHLIHDIWCRIRLEINSSSWTIMMNFLAKIVERILGPANDKSLRLGSACKTKVIADIIDILRLTVKVYGRNGSDSECTQLIGLLICTVSCLHAELLNLYQSSEAHHYGADNGPGCPKFNSLWEMQTMAFSMIGDALSRLGSSISVNLWQSVVEGLRKLMDFLASKNSTVENSIMSRFYATLLHCLHLVLTDPKGSISGHVTGFVATLQMFFIYGIHSRSPPLTANTDSKEKGDPSQNMNFGIVETRRGEHCHYRPPHLRRREGTMNPPDAQTSANTEHSKYNLSSSDSDLSDNDGSTKVGDCYPSSKARLAAIVCIQDLCHADPKSLSTVWSLLLPENDVLQPRKYQATLMTCLLFDPILKIRTAAASALAAILDGHSLVFLQVAEYQEFAKCGPFTTLSSSLGQILMQMHTGLLYLIKHETQIGLLACSFKVLMLLISATPYARMPGELLPTVVASVHSRIIAGLEFEIQHSGLLASAIGCLGATFSRSPPSVHVLKMLEEDISRGLVQIQQGSSMLFLLIHFSEQGRHPSIGFEALQALRAAFHNYPNIVTILWEHISASVSGLLNMPTSYDNSSLETFAGSRKGDTDRTFESATEKHTMAAMKVLDECLRAASGFKGTDDHLECRLRDIQLISDATRRMKISSAPSYELGGPEALKVYSGDCTSGCMQWLEAIEKHLPLALMHSSPMVRAASVTCFAGMTSSVFFSLNREKQEFVISSAISAAVNDEVTSVRSAACRAIGVVSCFSQIFSCRIVLKKFIDAAEFNTHDPTVTVRITASWAIANICDSLRHRASEMHLEISEGEVTYSESISRLAEIALRLTKDGDKIKSNAVRALGNLSRFVRFTHPPPVNDGPMDSICSHHMNTVSKPTLCLDSHWLERMVQAFVSCVTTGNVKVQWNVCHAMSNLFMNDTLKLQHMSWASAVFTILLLLLRDSTNFKIRIHAAVALAVPISRPDYGKSYPDVVQGLQNVLESVISDQGLAPSSYKYKDNLEKQLTLTSLHVLGFASSKEDQALKDFLVKKSSFLEEWFKSLISSFTLAEFWPPTNEAASSENGSIPFAAKKAMLSRAMKSLIDVYESSNQQAIARRLEMLADSLTT